MELMTSPTKVDSAAAQLERLSCPYCGGAFVATWMKGADSTGILSCACGVTPVIDGIVWFERRKNAVMRESPGREAALACLRAGDGGGARSQALLRSCRTRATRLLTILERLELRVPQTLAQRLQTKVQRSVPGSPRLSFAEAAALLRNGPYAEYLYQRFANPSLLASIPVMLLLKELCGSSRPRVLEIGGGVGHANFLMSRYFPEMDMVLTDGDFTNVYLARRFVTPSSTCLCVDAEARLPFADQSFDAVYCQDAFHYLSEKAGLVDELRRIVRPGGLWLFPHLHNALGHNRAAGFPLPPHDYARLFSFLDARIYPEMSLLEQFHRNQRLDLSRPADEQDLAAANTLTLIAGPKSLWRSHDLSGPFLRPDADLAINPIYQNRSTGGPLSWPNGGLREECLEAERFLPSSVNVDPGLLTRLKRQELAEGDLATVHDLIRNFVLVPLPANYAPAQASSTTASTPRSRSASLISSLYTKFMITTTSGLSDLSVCGEMIC